MSERMAEKRKQELEAFEKMETEKKEAKAVVLNTLENKDQCPVCHTFTREFPYVDGRLMQSLHLLECPFCGTVFCPESIRLAKLVSMGKKLPQLPINRPNDDEESTL